MCDFEAPAVFCRKSVTARLPHTCFSCGEVIVRGEQYEHVHGVWDGRGDDYRFHSLCYELEKTLMDDHGCGWQLGSLAEARHNSKPFVYEQALRTVFWRHYTQAAES